MSEIYEYSGYLTFAPLSDAKLQKVRSLAVQSGLAIDVGTTWLELEYAGRDANRKVRTLLRNLASIIGQAEGEIVCEMTNDDGDLRFEFYTMTSTGLYVQKGHIVREASAHKVYDG